MDHRRITAGLALGLALAACGNSAPGTPDGASGGDAGTDAGPSDTSIPPQDSSGGRDVQTPPADTGARDAQSPPGDSGAGGAAYKGTVLFTETFEDANYATRDWFDTSGSALSTAEHIPGSTSSFECHWVVGGQVCDQGSPGRHLIPIQQAVYLSVWVKYSADYVGSGHPYHPHQFHFITNEDDMWIGPGYTHLTTYVEQVGGYPLVGLQDGRNVDLNCIMRNDGSIVGCNGNFNSYPFTEMRSATACNGLLGDVQEHDCYPNGDGTWSSSRTWRSRIKAFDMAPGQYDQNQWHFVEAYFRMNTITNGVGIPDGKMRYWFDGQLLVTTDGALMRTGAHPNMGFIEFIVAPYIGDGSPVDQRMWIDDLTVAAGN